MQIDGSGGGGDQAGGQAMGALQAPSFFLQQADSPISQHSPDTNQFNENYLNDAIMSSGGGGGGVFVKNESDLHHKPFAVPFSRASGGRFPFGQIKEEPNVKVESIELDIDANDLISDINFNNMMINMGSDNNIITFNSSGNIKVENNAGDLNHNQLQTPNTLDIANIQQDTNPF